MRAFFLSTLCLLAGCGAAAGDRVSGDDVAVVVPGSVELLGMSRTPGVKTSLDVRLPLRASEAQLEAMAREFRRVNDDPRLFICYYLPEMEVGAGAWATSHFTPDLEVEILGATAGFVEEVSRAPGQGPGVEVVGVWIDETPFAGSRLTILRDGSGWHLEQVFHLDGSTSTRPLSESRDAKGRRRFDLVGNAFGEYFVIHGEGKLGIYDRDGLITKAAPMSP